MDIASNPGILLETVNSYRGQPRVRRLGVDVGSNPHTLPEWVRGDKCKRSVQGSTERTANVGTKPGNDGARPRVQRLEERTTEVGANSSILLERVSIHKDRRKARGENNGD